MKPLIWYKVKVEISLINIYIHQKTWKNSGVLFIWVYFSGNFWQEVYYMCMHRQLFTMQAFCFSNE